MAAALVLGAAPLWVLSLRESSREPPPAPAQTEPNEVPFAHGAVNPAECVRREPLNGERRARAFGAGRLGEVAGAVERVRGLRFRERVEPELVDQDELGRRVVRLAFAEYGEKERVLDERVLRALGVLGHQDDLRSLLKNALSAQVVGFYVPETNELVVSSSATKRSLSPLAELTLAHELEHALADQRLGFPLNERAGRKKAEAELAARAVVEGDATLTMLRYATSVMSLTDQLGIVSEDSIGRQTAAMERLPHLLQQSLEFPYEEGSSFVCALYSKGGWRAVNKAYARPPTTTAEILWPHLYRARPHRRPEALGNLRAPWQKQFRQPVGAADLLWLFEAPGDDRERALDDALLRAAAWRGGLVDVWTAGNQTALGISLLERDASHTLCGSMAQWYRATYPSATDVALQPREVFAARGVRQAAVVSCSGRHVQLGIAPDVGVARDLVALAG